MKRIAIVMLLSGCITPYQPRGWDGGYSETKLAPGVWEVQASGNAYTRAPTLQSYVLRRGVELCLADGYPHVRLVDAGGSTASAYVPPTYHTEAEAHSTGYGRARGSSTTTQSGGYNVNRHTVSAKAVCVTQEEWDAEQAVMRERLLQRAP